METDHSFRTHRGVIEICGFGWKLMVRESQVSMSATGLAVPSALLSCDRSFYR